MTEPNLGVTREERLSGGWWLIRQKVSGRGFWKVLSASFWEFILFLSIWGERRGRGREEFIFHFGSGVKLRGLCVGELHEECSIHLPNK